MAKDDAKGPAEEHSEHRRVVRPVVEGEVPPPTADHTCVLLDAPTRAMVLYGGHRAAQGPRDDVWEFSLDTKTWKHVTVVTSDESPELPVARCNHVAVAFGSRMLIFGGYGGEDHGLLNDCWLYSSETKAWTEVEAQGTPPTKRQNHSAVKLDDTKVLVFGGFDGTSRLADLHTLDVQTGEWEQWACSGLLPTARDSAALAVVGGLVYLFGGYTASKSKDLYRLDLASREWAKLPVSPGVPTGRYGHDVVVFHNKLYVFHGYDGVGGSNEVFEYDPAAQAWKDVEFHGETEVERRCQGSCVTVLPEKKVIAFGGWDGAHYLNSMIEYEFAEQEAHKEAKGGKKK
mmetsp:Transcript_71878/g.126648  ORF Transcript_71878/g.126648 Transcript_71878/m.126648 type:complete len:344 (-) Transcript_71878:576-1607(-)